MSTDYGFKCRECDDQAIIDNARASNVVALLSTIAEVSSIARLVAVGIAVVPLDGSYYNQGGAIDFLVEHHARGHTVVVADEYGREWDQCVKRVKCPTCGHTQDCTLKLTHEGECAAGVVVAAAQQAAQ